MKTKGAQAMTRIALFLSGVALGAALLGLLRPATAAAPGPDERFQRELVSAVKDIASEIRSAGRECRR